jgi:protein-S-isoprenylcysteine O-methyltransferase Ste14
MSKASIQSPTGAGIGPEGEVSPQRAKLGLKLAIRFSIGVLAGAAILFVPAGTLRFWRGWALLGTYFVPTSVAFIYFLRRDPQVVERRLERKETVGIQKLLIRWGTPAFLLAFLLPGFDYRWGWSRHLFGLVPSWLSLVSLAMVFAAFFLVFWVTQVNRFAARIIRVEEGQTVISDGPYRWVRHPMYFGSVVLWMFTPLALRSYVALPVFALLIPFYVIRLLNEEKVLRQELPGYPEYCLRTRYHLVPFVW